MPFRWLYAIYWNICIKYKMFRNGSRNGNILPPWFFRVFPDFTFWFTYIENVLKIGINEAISSIICHLLNVCTNVYYCYKWLKIDDICHFSCVFDTFWEYRKLLCKWISQAGKIVESHFSMPNSLWWTLSVTKCLQKSHSTRLLETCTGLSRTFVTENVTINLVTMVMLRSNFQPSFFWA